MAILLPLPYVFVPINGRYKRGANNSIGFESRSETQFRDRERKATKSETENII